MADLNHIALFAKVVECGSFSGAARALGYPKATVSRRVASLESALGVRLLHRTTRKLELTGPGRSYYDQAARALAQLERASQEVTAAQAVPSGTLRVAAPVDLGARFLVDWVAEFLAEYDRVRVELLLDDGMIDLVAQRVDVAIRTGRLASSSLIARRLGAVRRMLVASPAYLERRGEPRRIEDLVHHDCVVFGRSLDHVVWRLDGPRGSRDVAVHGRLAVDSVSGALRAAIVGLGIALLPSGPVSADLRAGRLRQVLDLHGVDGGAVSAVYPSNRHMSAALRAFLELVAAKAPALAP